MLSTEYQYIYTHHLNACSSLSERTYIPLKCPHLGPGAIIPHRSVIASLRIPILPSRVFASPVEMSTPLRCSYVQLRYVEVLVLPVEVHASPRCLHAPSAFFSKIASLQNLVTHLFTPCAHVERYMSLIESQRDSP